MRRVFGSGLVFGVCLVLSCPGNATTLNELEIGVRVFDFMTSPPRGKTPLAVFYDGQNAASQDDAQAILGWLHNETGVRRAGLVPALVDVRRAADFPGYHLAFVANGTAAYFNAVLDYALKNQTLTISADLSCMQRGKCAVGVTGVPRVEVVINRAVASSCGVEFTEAFRMMVREY